jgi:integrase
MEGCVMPKKLHVPSYRHHKPSGQAYVRIGGKFVYLGVHNSPESKREYGRIIAETAASPMPDAPNPQSIEGLTIVEVCAAYLDFAVGYYRKHGKASRHIEAIKLSIGRIKELYGSTPALEFGPRSLKALRQKMIDQGLSRNYINDQVENLKRMFKWAVSEELMPPSAYQGLSTVAGLRPGRTDARETPPIVPVAAAVVDATLPHLPAVVADMVRLQRLTGCRPGEVCIMRPVDVDRSNEVWEYRPSSHKTEHHGKQRTIYIGPQAQDVIRPYLLRPADTFCFQPAESEAKRHTEQRTKRRSKVQPSQQHRRKARRVRPLLTSYNKDSYGRAVRRAVVKANKAILEDAEHMGLDNPVLVPHWHPNQLRHSAATEIRKQFGLEAAQVILGHSRADVTQVYAERDSAKAIEVVKRIG